MCGFISELSVFLFCFVLFCFPLIYISVSVPVPYCLDDCGFVVEPEVVILFNLLAAFIRAVCFLLPGGGKKKFHLDYRILLFPACLIPTVLPDIMCGLCV